MWQNVWAASREYETTLVSLVPPGEDASPLPSVFEERGIRVIRVAHRPPSRPAAAWDGLFGPWPYTLARYRNPELPGTLRALVAETRPSFAMVTPLHMATYAEDLEGVPVVLRMHNLEFVWMERYARRLGLTPAGLYARAQVRRLRDAEGTLSRRASLVLAIQPEEATGLREVAPDARVEVLPVGVDLSRYQDPQPGEPPIVLLGGSFAWPPNVDGAIQFIRKGWPRVAARVPSARLRMVGKDPAPLARPRRRTSWAIERGRLRGIDAR